ncbi:glycosyltransferase [Puniceicoccaceae bacterium K14]|nr:glycosyltransferase [Puniceicoccaceae bacterium K14]
MENVSTKTKILVVGQTPPPYHGQAIMIETMLKGHYENLELIHVRMDFSENIDEVGSFQIKKIFKLFTLIFDILKTRFSSKAKILYYPPAGDATVPILRDIAILCTIRPFFKKTVFHFHAAGLLDGYNKIPRILRPLFHLAYKKPDNCLNISEKLPPISHFLKSKQHTVLPHGIDDPAIGFKRSSSNDIRQILFVGAVRESKGVMVLLKAARILLDKNLAFKLNIVGEFATRDFEKEARSFVSKNHLGDKVIFHGLCKGEEKWEQYRVNDIFCFPTFYENESFGIVLVEALAFGLPVVSSDWRASTDIISEPENGYNSKSKDSADLAVKLEALLQEPDLSPYWETNRKRFTDRYTTDKFVKRIDSEMTGNDRNLRKSNMKKLIVVGQTPPPYHGQAIMIETMLKGDYANADLVHVRMDFSEKINEVGTFSVAKIFKLGSLIVRIIHARIKHKATSLYYPPAGGTVIPICRDIIILLCTRIFFKQVLFHFHASGLIDGYNKLPSLLKPLFKLAYHSPDLAVTLSQSQPQLAEFLDSKEKMIIPNGIFDNASGFERLSFPAEKRILFMGAVIESKGVTNILEAAVILKEKGLRFSVDIAGEFAEETYEVFSKKFVADNNLEGIVSFLGLIRGDDKWERFKNCHIFCFPTFYENEAFPVVLLEALSFSMPIVVTDWRGCPDIVTEENGFIVKTQNPSLIADALIKLMSNNEKLSQFAQNNRQRFLEFYTTERYYENIDNALHYIHSK